ncbi:DUF1127 domain-containing protein [Roseibium sp. RKSG952]|uniref:DUF1127 domain-containing protein n=1 Tax=Roseibium sp. RKSG952 TaxID=2529384 RepID=UPI0012BB4A61|nr:DUF1127 domain-containing protein [Roseibium sp. RKSG952]MTH99771.1 DUF1127 domain-containing protein [Roseibium sp. RKSG952]
METLTHIATLVAERFETLVAVIEKHQAGRQLARMSDRSLKDIGVPRGQIDGAVLPGSGAPLKTGPSPGQALPHTCNPTDCETAETKNVASTRQAA